MTSAYEIYRYTIPGENGSLGEGKRFLNYVWYTNLAESSPEFNEAMTDNAGRRHHHTIPIGKMQSSVWDKQRRQAHQLLPRPFAELVEKTTEPFISTISDIDVSQAVFYNGKLLFVGDALVPFRPHVACSTNQAALDATLLEQLLKKEIDINSWEIQVLDYAYATQLRSQTWGCWYQVGYYAFFTSEVRYLATLCSQSLHRLCRALWS